MAFEGREPIFNVGTTSKVCAWSGFQPDPEGTITHYDAPMESGKLCLNQVLWTLITFWHHPTVFMNKAPIEWYSNRNNNFCFRVLCNKNGHLWHQRALTSDLDA
jgi:hypothetical protein